MKPLAVGFLALLACTARPTNQPIPVVALTLAFDDLYDSLSTKPGQWTEKPSMSAWWFVPAKLRHDPAWLNSLVESGRVRAACEQCKPTGEDSLSLQVYIRRGPEQFARWPDTLNIEGGLTRVHPPTWSSVWRHYTLVREAGQWRIADRSVWGHDHGPSR